MNSENIASMIFNFIIGTLEIIGEIVKGLFIIAGILAANVADVVMGAIAASILFGGANVDFYGYKSWQIASMLSLATSAIQLLLWNMIRNRGFRFSELFNFKRLSPDMKLFLLVSGFIWLLDTAMDISPLALMVQNSDFQSLPWVYHLMIFVVGGLLFLICGFSEPITANIKSLVGSRKTGDARSRYSQPSRNANRSGSGGGLSRLFGGGKSRNTSRSDGRQNNRRTQQSYSREDQRSGGHSQQRSNQSRGRSGQGGYSPQDVKDMNRIIEQLENEGLEELSSFG